MDWRMYLAVNKDIQVPQGEDPEQFATNHWQSHGVQEQRPTSFTNDTRVHHARFGNLFFVNMAAHFIALQRNLHINYKYHDQFQRLGVELFQPQNPTQADTYNNNVTVLDDTNFLDYVYECPSKTRQLRFTNNAWFQSRPFVELLWSYFRLIPSNRLKIEASNPFLKEHEDDVFVHVRLGDLVDRMDALDLFTYYETALQSLPPYSRGFLSSDSMQHPLCQRLMYRFRLIPLSPDAEEVDLVQHANACRYLVLSGGTFSFLMAFFNYRAEKVFYPVLPDPWYGDIFYPWTGIPCARKTDEKKENKEE